MVRITYTPAEEMEILIVGDSMLAFETGSVTRGGHAQRREEKEKKTRNVKERRE